MGSRRVWRASTNGRRGFSPRGETRCTARGIGGRRWSGAPEMIERAGGVPLLARSGGDSVRVTRDDVIAARPDVVIVAPCGFNADAAAKQAMTLDLPAKRVFAVDANSYFARPGPRLIDGVELLAQLLH